ncbi:CMP deaminase [Deltaproteobacteria bacterium Smac51]|nr:CMP deaminase [Deltaproteobacteria bacterium Smac51]
MAGKADLNPELLAQRLTPRPAWDEYFMAIAKVISTRSTCSSRPVGCVIVRDHRILVSGYNGPPSGHPHCTECGDGHDIFCLRRSGNIPDDKKHEHCPSVHAEDNAIGLAETLNVNLEGSSLYITLAPCIRCTELLRKAGVHHVFFELRYQSIDPVRDAAWEKEARSWFKTYEEATISKTSLNKMVGALTGITSERLLPSG